MAKNKPDTIYFYDPTTGQYTGQGLTDLNPRTKRYDLTPAFATTLAPPNVGKDQVAVFKDGRFWTVEDVAPPEPEEVKLTAEQQREQDLAAVKYQIAVIEETGIRAMREVMLTGSEDSKARLQCINDQIAELRESLK